MAYRFNNGNGGVTCDKCNLLIDANLSFKEYEEWWGKKGDFCWKCKTGFKEENVEKKDEPKNDRGRIRE